jgi:hypothetical protein
MKPVGMDSRLEQRARVVRMVCTLLETVEVSRREANRIAALLKVKQPKASKALKRCRFGHMRTPGNVGAGGACLPCERIREASEAASMERGNR